jgi:hypothetical protein
VSGAELRVRLRGVLPHTASSATIEPHGGLVVELYDFSAEAQRWLGNDVAFFLRLDAPATDLVRERLLGSPAPAAAARDELLLQLMENRFEDYYAVKQWLDDEGIPYRKEFEPWA